MARRLLLAAVAVLDIVLLLAIGAVAFGYVGQRTWMNLGDHIILWTPLAVAVLGLASNIWMLSNPPRISRATRWAVFLGLHVLLVVMAAYLATRYHLIAHDGTAYWGLLFVPCLLIGAPLLSAAILIGGIVDLFRVKRRRKLDSAAS